MTKITFTRKFEKQLEKVPEHIRIKVQAWTWSVMEAGLRQTQQSPGLHDEPLKGGRAGQRSIRLNRSYRLIYRVIEKQIHIELLEVHKHEY